MTCRCHEPAYSLYRQGGWRGGAARPLRTPGVPRPCRADGRGCPPNPPSGAHMAERRTGQLNLRVSPAELAVWRAKG